MDLTREEQAALGVTAFVLGTLLGLLLNTPLVPSMIAAAVLAVVALRMARDFTRP